MIYAQYGFALLGVLTIYLYGSGEETFSKEIFSDVILEKLCEGADNLDVILNQYAIASVNVQSIDQKEDNNSFYDTHIVPLIALASQQKTEQEIIRDLINRFNQYLDKKETDLLIDISKHLHKKIDSQPQFDMIKRAFNLFLSVDDLLENIVAEQRNIPNLPVKNFSLPEVCIGSVCSNSNVRLYLCRYSCGHKSEHKGNVRRHEKTCFKRPADTPEVFKYHCQYSCGYESIRKDNVTTHEQRCKLRPDDIPEVFKYSCQYNCGYGSVYKSNVTMHEKTCKLRPSDAPKIFKHFCKYDCGYGSVHKANATTHAKNCKLRPGGPQVIGSKRKSNDDHADPRKRRIL